MNYLSYRENVVLFFTILSILGGCHSTSSAPENGIEINPNSELECEREGFPCRLTEIPKDVFNASVEALEDAYEALDQGDMEDARTLLESRRDLADIQWDDSAIRFRLEGGQPVWLIDVTGTIPDESPKGPTYVPSAIVGDDTNNDGSKDNRDNKRALVLAPYYWQFSPYDESPLLAERLNLLPGYKGNVRYVRNPNKSAQNVTLADWSNWDKYDGIFISTHGTHFAIDGKESVVISSGIFVKYDSLDSSLGERLLYVYSRNKQSTFEYIQYGLSTDFFRTVYPSGLDDTIVVFSACKTGDEGASDLADALTGNNVVMMGWTESVLYTHAYNASGAFNEYLGLGLTTERALAKLQEQGIDRGLNSDNVMSVFTRFASGEDQRLIEVPTLLDENEEPLKDGSDLSGLLDGKAGDGEPDVLTVTTRLDGVEEGTESGYRITYTLGETELQGEYDLSLANRLDATAVTDVHNVDLGMDAPKEPTDLMAVVDLPEGGESRYVAEISLAAQCGWSMTFSGADHNGSYEGDFVGVQLGTPSTIILQESLDSFSYPGITIQLYENLPEEVPATLLLGLTGSDEPNDGLLTISYEDAVYRSGDGSPCCTQTNPQDSFTPPMTLEITKNEPDLIKGTLSGNVWAYAPDGGTPLRKAAAELSFTVTPNNECRISDPSDPL